LPTIVVVPAEKVSIRKILKDIFASADVRTWRISSGGTVLTHSQYGGKVHLYKGGYLTVSAENNDYEALTLGAFINLLYRRAKENIKAITIVF
jgi:hypothetical protein